MKVYSSGKPKPVPPPRPVSSTRAPSSTRRGEVDGSPLFRTSPAGSRWYRPGEVARPG